MFLVSYEDVIFNSKLISSYTPGILNLGIYHRKRKRFGLVCCPSCLSEPIPYYKKEWRIFFSVGCTKCKCFLIDKCTKCNSPIAFHRLENGHKEIILDHPLYLCSCCGYDLRKYAKLYSSNSPIDIYQKYIDETINNRFNSISQYSFSYFSVLLHLMKQLSTASKNWNRVKIVVEDYFKIRLPSHKEINPLDGFKDRRIKLLICYKILDDWPKSFIKIFEGTNVRLSDFSKEYYNMPFWFEKVIKDLD